MDALCRAPGTRTRHLCSPWTETRRPHGCVHVVWGRTNQNRDPGSELWVSLTGSPTSRSRAGILFSVRFSFVTFSDKFPLGLCRGRSGCVSGTSPPVAQSGRPARTEQGRRQQRPDEPGKAHARRRGVSQVESLSRGGKAGWLRAGAGRRATVPGASPWRQEAAASSRGCRVPPDSGARRRASKRAAARSRLLN